jgi:hypothetical protein
VVKDCTRAKDVENLFDVVNRNTGVGHMNTPVFSTGQYTEAQMLTLLGSIWNVPNAQGVINTLVADGLAPNGEITLEFMSWDATQASLESGYTAPPETNGASPSVIITSLDGSTIKY